MQHMAVRSRLAAVALLGLCAVAGGGFGCGGNQQRGIGDRVVDPLLQHDDIRVVTFTLAGNASCPDCAAARLTPSMLLVQVYPTSDPTDTLADGVFPAVGPFSLQNVKHVAGEEVRMLATLRCTDARGGTQALSQDTTITVPQEDAQTLAFTLVFQP